MSESTLVFACPKCGQVIASGVNPCPYCGMPIEWEGLDDFQTEPTYSRVPTPELSLPTPAVEAASHLFVTAEPILNPLQQSFTPPTLQPLEQPVPKPASVPPSSYVQLEELNAFPVQAPPVVPQTPLVEEKPQLDSILEPLTEPLPQLQPSIPVLAPTPLITPLGAPEPEPVPESGSELTSAQASAAVPTPLADSEPEPELESEVEPQPSPVMTSVFEMPVPVATPSVETVPAPPAPTDPQQPTAPALDSILVAEPLPAPTTEPPSAPALDSILASEPLPAPTAEPQPVASPLPVSRNFEDAPGLDEHGKSKIPRVRSGSDVHLFVFVLKVIGVLAWISAAVLLVAEFAEGWGLGLPPLFLDVVTEIAPVDILTAGINCLIAGFVIYGVGAVIGLLDDIRRNTRNRGF